jgi:hypothetical protein
MDKLFPIVRRVRRPLLPADEPRSRSDAEVTAIEAGSRENARFPGMKADTKKPVSPVFQDPE